MIYSFNVGPLLLDLISDVNYGDDLSYLLNSDKITNHILSLDDNLPDYYDVNLLGWSGADDLSYVTKDIEVRPLIEFVTVSYSYYFNPETGQLPAQYTNVEDKGISVYRNQTISSDFIEAFNPTKASTTTNEYNFIGWGQIIDGVWTEFDFSTKMTNNVYLVAKYEEIDRKYSITLNSNGNVYEAVNGIYQEINVNSYFNNNIYTNDIEIVFDNLIYLEFIDLKTKIESNDDSIIKPDDVNNEYTFSYYTLTNTSNSLNDYVYSPMYKTKTIDTEVSLIFDISYGQWNNLTGQFVFTDVVKDNNYIVHNVDDLFVPSASSTGVTYDFENKKFVYINYSFMKDGYYYIPKGWSIDGVNILPPNYQITLDKNNTSQNLYMLYEEYVVPVSIIFVIEPGMLYSDNNDSRYKEYVLPYNGLIDSSIIPTVTKLSESWHPYEYNFVDWMNQDTLEVGLPISACESGVYVPIFEKVIKEFTITFDAGENGYFPSTSDRYKTVKAFSGTYITDFEEPMYNSDSLYYDIIFTGWTTGNKYLVTIYDDTIRAYSRKIRNQTPAELTNITISNGIITEDIAYNTIPGYEYDPDEKILMISEPNLIIDGNGQVCDISIQTITSQLTLKDITINNYMMINIYNDPLKKYNTTVNIVGDVTINYSSVASYVSTISTNTEEISFIGAENSTLTLTYDIIDGTFVDYGNTICVIDIKNLLIENLTVNINIDLPDNLSGCGIRYGKMSLISSVLTIKSLNENNLTIYDFDYYENSEFINENSNVYLINVNKKLDNMKNIMVKTIE